MTPEGWLEAIEILTKALKEAHRAKRVLKEEVRMLRAENSALERYLDDSREIIRGKRTDEE